MSSFPQRRMRRLRYNPILRQMVAETELSLRQLIYPLFVVPGSKQRREVPSMPGVYNLSIDELVKEAKEVVELGIPAILLFGVPEKKDEVGSEAYAPEGIIQRAVRALKKEVKDILVITDVCLCEYTSHGHCGIVRNGEIQNDETLELLAKTSRAQVEAGSDMVAPSDMMDGRVRRIRQELDAHGFAHIPIVAYAAKYASAFYGPFRDAAQSAPAFGDRRSHQLNPANAREAEMEVMLDIEEGADIIMIKPALAYLDIIRRVREKFNLPIAAFNVSGEYAMVKATAQLGWLEEEALRWEILTAIRRAGADLILTYFAKDTALWLNKQAPRKI